MYGAGICACLLMLSVVVAHYDRRNKERHYRAVARHAEFVGWTRSAVSAVWPIVGDG